MTKSDAKEILSRCKPGETITFFTENGFSVIVNNVDEVSGSAITGTDVTGRRFCVSLDHVQLAQIKGPNVKPIRSRNK